MQLNAYLDQIRPLGPGEYFLATPDQRGDGYDIACSPHTDVADQIRTIHPTAILHKIYANGYLCGYRLIIPDPQELMVLVQHSGTWGPWYHVSCYRRAPHTKSGYIFVRYVGGHYSYARCPDLPIGRPKRTDPQYAY